MDRFAGEAFARERLADVGVQADAAELVFGAGAVRAAAGLALDQQIIGAEADAFDFDALPGFDGLGDVGGEFGRERAERAAQGGQLRTEAGAEYAQVRLDRVAARAGAGRRQRDLFDVELVGDRGGVALDRFGVGGGGDGDAD